MYHYIHVMITKNLRDEFLRMSMTIPQPEAQILSVTPWSAHSTTCSPSVSAGCTSLSNVPSSSFLIPSSL